MLEMSKIDINPITMYSLNHVNITSNNSVNKLQQLKIDQQSNISQVSIFRLFTSFRFSMNCILATMQNALFILLLQIIVPYLTSYPYDLSLGQVSLIMSAGTISILINAVVMYVIN